MKNVAQEILDAPANVAQFDTSLVWKPSLVDYTNHPAYQQHVETAPLMLRAKALFQFTRSMVPLLIKRLVRYEMIPVEVRSPKSAGGFVKLAGVAGRNALGLHRKAAKTDQPSPVHDKLSRDGCCVVRIADETFAELTENSKTHFERLEQRRAAKKEGERDFDESRSSVDAREHGNTLFMSLEKTLQDTGVLDAASRYLGREARLIDVNPQINDASDSFWRNIFPDMEGFNLPGSAYFHRDASGGDLKAIFYMSDVGPENGPFSYVVGSNNLSISKLDDLIAEANDHNGLSATAPNARKRFAALPSKLRQKGSFGNDLGDSDRLAQEIQSITAPKGSIVLFDTKGVHRGGMVVDGSRYVITTVIG